MKKTLKGFTLIELLVVIAIIGILSSVVLASLNTARAKGADAAIKSNLANIRAQAELYYDNNNNSYAPSASAVGNCSLANTMFQADTTIQQAITSATSASGGAVNCRSTATAWAVSAQLKSNTAQYWCVDSTGVSKQTAGAISTTACP